MNINCRGKLLDLTQPIVMGILNVTPDSFYDGGKGDSGKAVQDRIDRIVADGADIVDVGGMSSKPGATIVPAVDEKKRIAEAIDYLQKQYPNQLVSIDTIHSEVAEFAVRKGVQIINDISGGEHDPRIIDVAIANDCPYVLMHMQGNPQTMQDAPDYQNVSLDLLKYFQSKIRSYRAKGLKDILIDPGFGFGKTIEHNYQLLRELSSFTILDCPVLVGLSRKSMLYKVLQTTPDKALNATSAAHMLALGQGAKILRVHDVKEAKECIQIFKQYEGIK